MFRKLSIEKSSKPVLSVDKLQDLLTELPEQSQEKIAGGNFRFPCDGPGRGGTCQISSWEHILLG